MTRSMVAFVKAGTGRGLVLAATLLAGATPGEAQSGFIQEVTWAPDGRRLSVTVITPERPYPSVIQILSADGAVAERVGGSLASARWGAWHPDGRHLAFAGKADDRWDLYVADLATDSLRRITDTPEDESAPSWSPDGSQLVYMVRIDDRSQLFVSAADGSGRRRLATSDRNDWNPMWSPTGEWIAFYAAADTTADHLFLIRPDGTGERQLTTGRVRDVFPTWSPDGRRLLYSHDGEDATGVYTIGIAAGNRTLLVPDGFYGRLSPDGSRLAYLVGHWPADSIMVARPDGTSARRLR